MKLPKQILGSVLIVTLLLGSGCSTLQRNADMGSAAVRVATSAGAIIALNKNPRYLPVASALAAGMDAAISENATLTLEGIERYVRDVCTLHGVTDNDTSLFVGLAQSVYTAYVTAYRKEVVASTDPTALLYVAAFKDGLKDAVRAIGGG